MDKPNNTNKTTSLQEIAAAAAKRRAEMQKQQQATGQFSGTDGRKEVASQQKSHVRPLPKPGQQSPQPNPGSVKGRAAIFDNNQNSPQPTPKPRPLPQQPPTQLQQSPKPQAAAPTPQNQTGKPSVQPNPGAVKNRAAMFNNNQNSQQPNKETRPLPQRNKGKAPANQHTPAQFKPPLRSRENANTNTGALNIFSSSNESLERKKASELATKTAEHLTRLFESEKKQAWPFIDVEYRVLIEDCQQCVEWVLGILHICSEKQIPNDSLTDIEDLNLMRFLAIMGQFFIPTSNEFRNIRRNPQNGCQQHLISGNAKQFTHMYHELFKKKYGEELWQFIGLEDRYFDIEDRNGTNYYISKLTKQYPFNELSLFIDTIIDFGKNEGLVKSVDNFVKNSLDKKEEVSNLNLFYVISYRRALELAIAKNAVTPEQAEQMLNEAKKPGGQGNVALKTALINLKERAKNIGK